MSGGQIARSGDERPRRDYPMRRSEADEARLADGTAECIYTRNLLAPKNFTLPTVTAIRGASIPESAMVCSASERS